MCTGVRVQPQGLQAFILTILFSFFGLIYFEGHEHPAEIKENEPTAHSALFIIYRSFLNVVMAVKAQGLEIKSAQ